MTTFDRTKIAVLLILMIGLIMFVGCAADRVLPVESNKPEILDEPQEPDDSVISVGPQLTIDNPTFDFGIVPQYSYVSRTFWLKSTGDEPLHIHSASGG